jgi:hypothetical protein
MPKQTLQDETSDALTEHQIELNKYGQAQRTKVMDKISELLIDIKTTLLKGSQEVTLGELRNMMRIANRMFKEGFKAIRTETEEETYELLQLELTEQTKLLQNLIDDYEIPYDVREPSYILAKRKLKDLPIEDNTFETWFNLWEVKTNGRMKSGLYSEYTTIDGESKDRTTLVEDVFGRGKDPFIFDTFKGSNRDMNGLLISIIDGTNSVTSDSIAQSNSGIIEGVIWNSVLDSGTCARCASLNNSIRYLNGPDETDGNEIPLHPNCLCFWTYLYKKPKSMSVKVPKTASTEINSQKGLKKFPLWYNSLSDLRKAELLGRTKVKMIDSGEITVSQLLTKKNRRVYTLDELKQKGYKIPEK